MEKFYKRSMGLTLALLLAATIAYAQTTVSGTVKDKDTGEGLAGVNIIVKGSVVGTITNTRGEFRLSINQSPPLSLTFSFIGYANQEIQITDANTTELQISLEELTILGQEVVISASRHEETILKSPVSIERMNILHIENTASTDFYSSIKNMNGVDFSTQSLTFNSVNARGFGANGNNRFVQLIDGIDNQAPGLNFPVGNVVGINEIDLESLELIPGAASALYGPNALQGILLMNSKSPFEYQGLDFYTKLGVNHVDGKDDDAALYRDIGFRYAKAFNNKVAFKITGSWLNAQDFRSVDYRDMSDLAERSPQIDPLTMTSAIRSNDFRNYNGVNTYGEFDIDIGTIADIAIAGGNTSVAAIRTLLPSGVNGAFTPRGYRERDFVDNTTESIKFGAALHYRLSDKVEAFAQYNQGWGSSVYTANDRFILDNFTIWTGKLELRGTNFFLRAYTTQEDAGDTYAANTVTQRINQEFYLPAYFGTWATAVTGGNPGLGIPSVASNDYNTLHLLSRTVADGVQPQPGSAAFNEAYDKYRNLSIADGGAKFLDKSALYHYEGSYNFKEQIDWADIVVGANFRTYALNSEGTLFTLDPDGEEISFSEYGGYAQIKKGLSDKFDIQLSGRYDKNENFKGQFTPRVSMVWEFAKDHNLRGSYQTGFRIPTTQDQYIDLDVVTRRLIGRNQILRDYYNIDRNPVYSTESVQLAQQTGNVADLQVAADVYKEYVPEKVRTWEAGYKGLLMDGKLFVDAFVYWSTYEDLLAEIDITQAVVAGASLKGSAAIPAGYGDGHTAAELEAAFITGTPGIRTQRYGYDVNIDESVKTRGFGLGAEYSIGRGYNLGGNISNNKMVSLDDLVAQKYNVAFNTPEWRYNLSFSNRKVTNRLGFNLTYRWQDAYLWQSAFGSGVVPAFGTLDAQVSYSIPNLKAKVKIGGSNVTNERYTTSFGNPRMGAIYYVQLNLNNLLN
jgi:iron complex outermembrane recepter protein